MTRARYRVMLAASVFLLVVGSAVVANALYVIVTEGASVHWWFALITTGLAPIALGLTFILTRRKWTQR